MESYDGSRSFSFLFLQQFNSMLSTNTSTFNTCSTPTPVNSTSIIFMFLFFSARWILRIHSDFGNFCFQGFLIFFVSHVDICTRFSTGSMSSPMGATSRFRDFVGLTSALLCHLRFPTVDSFAKHCSASFILWVSALLGSCRN